MGRRHTAEEMEQKNTARRENLSSFPLFLLADLIQIFWYVVHAGDVLLTLSAAPLQTFPLGFKVVLVAHAAAVVKEFTAHGGGVVEVMLEKPKAGSRVWSCFTGLCERERERGRIRSQRCPNPNPSSKMPSGVQVGTYRFR